MKNIIIIFLLLCTLACNTKTIENEKQIADSIPSNNPIEAEYKPNIEIEFNLLDTVISNLKLNKEECKIDLIASKLNPINPGETIMVIPEILKIEDDGDYFELRNHILIANTLSGEIIFQYQEDTNTDIIISDAIRLEEIKIDTAPYLLAASERAFGVRLSFANNSRPNPYSYESISLYLPKDEALLRLLKDYEVMSFHGESDTTCYGDFISTKTLLIVSENYTNGFLNILANSKVTEIRQRPDEKDECTSTESSKTEKTILKFDGNVYK